MRYRVRLIHWNATEAEERAARLQALEYDVDYQPLGGPTELRELRDHPPAAVVIDLSRLPSHGREVAMALRQYKATRHVPLVFVEGDAEKVARIRTLLPDATFTTWSDIPRGLKKAIAEPPATPVVPESNLAGYSGTPLPKKLGIRPNSVVALVGAPPDFAKTLGELPTGAKLSRAPRGRRDLTLWFVRSRADFEPRIARMVAHADGGGLWIIWPKKASGVDTDLTQHVVREVALATGLVDFKVSAIDATWSGLRFSRARKK